MFSGALELINAGIEITDVKHFREHSVELKRLREIAIKLGNDSSRELLTEIDRAFNFSTLLELTEQFNFSASSDKNDAITGKMARSGMSALFHLSGLVSDQSKFNYHSMQFREETIKHMAEKGYMPNHGCTNHK